jgi:hypothetical protein
MTLDQLRHQYNELVGGSNFQEAESYLHQILQQPGQAWQVYLYLPAHFYEDWGDYAARNGAEAVAVYQKALQYRREIGHQATGSGEGMEAMYHIKRIVKKLKQLG